MVDARPGDSSSNPSDRLLLLRRFFSGVTEHAFSAEIGIADPPLVDYVAELLVRFVRSDELFALRGVRGERLTKVSDMLAEATARRGPAKRRVHCHIGDFTLFWTGVYPEIAERMRRQSGADALLNYRELGKRNYLVAAQIPVENAAAPCDVLERLSDQFELCVAGLGEVRRLWDEREGEGSTGLLI